jgi:hypothetical protein
MVKWLFVYLFICLLVDAKIEDIILLHNRNDAVFYIPCLWYIAQDEEGISCFGDYKPS